jgi:ribosomal protein L29
VKRSEFKRQIQNSSTKEIEAALAEERKNLFGFRQQISMKQLDNLRAIRESRRRIAIMLTVLRQRRAEESKEQGKK